MSEKLTVAIAGLGNRGRHQYAIYAQLFPEEMEIVAVADIVPEKVQEAMETFNVPKEMCFDSAEEMLEKEQLADIMFVCTQDRQHVGHAIPALERGYHLLLEKPVSPDFEELKQIVSVSDKVKKHVAVCHVLRYTPFFQKVKQVIESGDIGQVMAIQAIENVGYYHQAHSFVRGNWNNSAETSPMILAKSCHDMDILIWLAGKSCEKVSSFGNLTHFKEDNAPEGSTTRCLDGCKAKEACPYDAEKIYIHNKLTGIKHGNTGWPINVLTMNPTEESVYEAIKTGPYGRCVYHCNNDVVDHQVVNLQLENEATVSFTMCAFTETFHRHLKVMGTKGEINADMSTNLVDVYKFGQGKETIDISKLSDDFSGHGGGDNQLVKELLDLVRNDSAVGSALTSLDKSVESHYISLAAEYSRLHGGEGIELKDFINNNQKYQ